MITKERYEMLVEADKTGANLAPIDFEKMEEYEKAHNLPDAIGGRVGARVILETAENIVEELFQNGFNQKAQRLVLELEDKSNGGGWGKKPVIDVIVKHIKSSLSK